MQSFWMEEMAFTLPQIMDKRKYLSFLFQKERISM